MPENSWLGRIWVEFRLGNFTRTERDVLLTLRGYGCKGAPCVPAHETLAERTKAGVRTVQRALKQARELGLIVWAERRVKRGWRWLRTSNSYQFLLPDTPAQPGMRPKIPRRATNGQNGRGDREGSKKAALEALMREAQRMPDLLAARRQRVLAAQAAALAARR